MNHTLDITTERTTVVLHRPAEAPPRPGIAKAGVFVRCERTSS